MTKGTNLAFLSSFSYANSKGSFFQVYIFLHLLRKAGNFYVQTDIDRFLPNGLHMFTLKRLFLTLITVMLLQAVGIAQPERVGVGLTFSSKRYFNYGDTGNPGIALKTWIGLDRKKNLHLVPSITAFSPNNRNYTAFNVTNYQFFGDIDLQYKVYHEKTLKLVAMTGVNYTYIISKSEQLYPMSWDPVDSTTYGLGPSLGLALEMRMGAFVDFIVSGKYSFTGLQLGDPALEEKFLIAPLSTPVIQVQFVYYFYSRGRGYSKR